MDNAYKKLLGESGTAIVRSGRTAADAANWEPTADTDILDGRMWKKIRVYSEFIGTPTGSPTLTVVPMIQLPMTDGFQWTELASTALAQGTEATIETNGHLVAFRVTVLVLGGTTSANVRVTGGERVIKR